jgi:hypothetical protein
MLASPPTIIPDTKKILNDFSFLIRGAILKASVYQKKLV